MTTPLPIRTFPAKKENHYIVLLHDHVSKEQHFRWLKDHLNSGNSQACVTYDFNSDVVHAYTGEFNNVALEALRRSPHVKSISEDGKDTEDFAIADQTNSPWGISRLSTYGEMNLQANQNVTDLTFDYEYKLLPVDAYIIDGGILTTHHEFAGRASWGITYCDGEDETDTTVTKSHGTHCAGTVGGNTFGVMKDVHLIAVKAVGQANKLKGLEWVINQVKNVTGKPSVANLSWGWPVDDSDSDPANSPIDIAVANMVRAGIHVVIAAGNKNWDVSKTTPARVTSAITVASMNIKGYRAKSSNYGNGIDIFAPGEKITSAAIDSNDAVEVKSGTSMAAPHVTGLVAYLLARYGYRTPAEMKALLDLLSLKGVLQDTEEHPLKAINKLVHNDVNNPQLPKELVEFLHFQFRSTVSH